MLLNFNEIKMWTNNIWNSLVAPHLKTQIIQVLDPLKNY